MRTPHWWTSGPPRRDVDRLQETEAGPVVDQCPHLGTLRTRDPRGALEPLADRDKRGQRGVIDRPQFGERHDPSRRLTATNDSAGSGSGGSSPPRTAAEVAGDRKVKPQEPQALDRSHRRPRARLARHIARVRRSADLRRRARRRRPERRSPAETRSTRKSGQHSRCGESRSGRVASRCCDQLRTEPTECVAAGRVGGEVVQRERVEDLGAEHVAQPRMRLAQAVDQTGAIATAIDVDAFRRGQRQRIPR